MFLIALVCLPSRELRCGHCMIGRAGREEEKMEKGWERVQGEEEGTNGEEE